MKYGDLNPAADVKFSVAPPQRSTSLCSRAESSAEWCSPPSCERPNDAGYGEVLITPKEVPLFKDYLHEMLATRKSFATKNPDALKRVATALRWAPITS
ncbi:MAG: hypothetical protein ACYDHE_02360 [Candidatus Acidiferrales bacterium]